ncbi:MAG: M20/M25/M40 family metallo-hydrolase [Acidobacteria bacterium]|nr:M20/M25/M40 family metallo-hydrolase [Acidobacteriota bacterium]
MRQALIAVISALVLRAVPAVAQGAVDPTAALLQEIIRLDTSNPPGHEGLIDELLASKLKPLGFEVTIVPTPEAGKSHLIARLKGDGSKRPVLLAAHADVVGVERDKWTVDPFGGVIKDGHVYGRGAIDFKGGMAVFARAVMQLAERKVPLSRDVIFVVEADEEAAQYNTSWLAQSHWAEMDAEFALNEGGWIIADDAGKVRYVSVSTADKSSVGIIVSATGTSTHSSMPRPDNAIFALSKALAKIAGYEFPVQLTDANRKFIAVLARTSPQPLAGYYQALLGGADAAARAAADREISKDPLMHAIIRNTIAPVIINGGFRSNVIPGSAEATLNARLLPAVDPKAVVAALQKLVDDPAVTVRLSNPNAGPSRTPVSPEDNELYRALEKHAKATFAGAEVTPYTFQAGTDAGAWRSRGVPVYGIYPYPITADELTRMHGNDEKVSIDSLRKGTEMIFNTLVEVAGKGR